MKKINVFYPEKITQQQFKKCSFTVNKTKYALHPKFAGLLYIGLDKIINKRETVPTLVRIFCVRFFNLAVRFFRLDVNFSSWMHCYCKLILPWAGHLLDDVISSSKFTVF